MVCRWLGALASVSHVNRDEIEVLNEEIEWQSKWECKSGTEFADLLCVRTVFGNLLENWLWSTKQIKSKLTQRYRCSRAHILFTVEQVIFWYAMLQSVVLQLSSLMIFNERKWRHSYKINESMDGRNAHKNLRRKHLKN